MDTAKQESFSGAVLIPAGQALISGAFIGFSAGSIGWLLEAPNPLALGLAGTAVTSTLAWLNYRAQWEERLAGMLGLSSPEVPQAGAYATETIRLDITNLEGTQGDFLDLPVPKDLLLKLAVGVQDGRSLSVHNWIGSSGPFTRGQFDKLRDELIRRGYARWKNPHSVGQGMELSAKGRALFRGLAATALHPPTEGPIAQLFAR